MTGEDERGSNLSGSTSRGGDEDSPSADELGNPLESDGAGVHPYAQRKETHLRRLRRIEGQVRGLQRMVDEDVYCIDVLTQVSAATRALQSFALELLTEHMNGCVVDAARTGDEEAETKVREAADAIARLVRS